MKGNTKIFTVVMPQDINRADVSGKATAWLCFPLDGLGLHNGCTGARGGLMGIYCPSPVSPSCASIIDIKALCRELSARGMEGILLDLPDEDFGRELALALCPAFDRAGIRYFIPEPLSAYARNGIYLIPSAVSGGTFREMLEHYISKYGADRLAIDMIRTKNDFILPSRSAEGKLLTDDRLRDILDSHGGESYYSNDLCCKYFTYIDSDHKPHFVMFDDSSTAKAKIDAAKTAGIGLFFALACEWGPDFKTPYPI